MTQRQEMMYEYLLLANDWVSMDVLASRFHGGISQSARRRVREDIEAIRFSDKPKVVVSGVNGYKIGSLEESRKFLDGMIEKHRKGLIMAYMQRSKLANDGSVMMNRDDELQVIKAYLEGAR